MHTQQSSTDGAAPNSPEAPSAEAMIAFTLTPEYVASDPPGKALLLHRYLVSLVGDSNLLQDLQATMRPVRAELLEVNNGAIPAFVAAVELWLQAQPVRDGEDSSGQRVHKPWGEL